ncbi:MAG: tetratricopeptide repeat protein [Ignavibacteria bacterium]|nr:tetratricopeptide repeat protein [Ignavibacteria bacterium]
MSILNIIFLIVCLLIPKEYIHSQTVQTEKLKLAQSYEKIGEFAKAETIYQELYNFDKSKREYFDGLVRCKKALNKFSELIPLIEEQLQKSRKSDLLILGGEIYWRLGNTEKATNYWNEAIKLKPKQDSLYFYLSEVQSNLKLFDKAIETLELARKNISDTLFSYELVKLYFITQNYEKLIEETLTVFHRTNNLANVQANLSFVLENKEARQIIETKLRQPKKGMEYQYILLYAWYLYSIKDYSNALKKYIELDEYIKADGYEVFKFTQTALNDNEFDISIKACEYIISLGKKSPYFQNAILGLAKAIDRKATLSTSLDKKLINDVIDKYNFALNQLPAGSSFYFETLFRIAELKTYYLYEFSSAEKTLEEIVKKRYGPLIWKSNLLLADIKLFNYNYDKALKMYKETFNSLKHSKPLEYYIATQKIAKLYYYTAKIDSSLYYYSILLEDSPPEFASEALASSIFIENNKQYNQALSYIAKSDLLLEINKIDSSNYFLQLAKEKSEGTYLEEYSTKRIIKNLFAMNLFVETENLANEFLRKYPESIHSDEILFYLGYSQFKQDKKVEAISTFTNLLMKFPRSIFNPKARDLIKQLRDRDS